MMPRYAHLLALVVLAMLVASGPAFAQTDYDTDNDNLIDVTSLAQLNAIRWDLNGDGAIDASASTSDTTAYNAAFPNAMSGMGCQSTCTGYELLNNLDFDENSDNEITSADATYWNSGAGWAPIGNSETKYTGTFHGNDNTISNLFIDRSAANDIGLFGFAEGGTIRNLSLVNADVTGNAETAVLVGEGNRLHLLHIRVTGQVGGFARSAGLVGTLAHGNSTITACRSEVDVTGSFAPTGRDFQGSSQSGTFGGLVGWNSGTITASYATGTVIGYSHVGGLVGFNGNTIEPRASIRASYATGAATGRGNVGGLVGSNFYSSTITGSYAIGPSISTANFTSVGGLVGFNFGSTVNHSYYDSTATGRSDAGRGAPQTTADLQTPTRYTGIYQTWNLNLDGQPGGDDPWTFGATDQYPVLKYAGMDTTAQYNLQPPSIPTSVTMTIKADTLDVRWRAVSGATGYKVQWKSGTQSYDTASREATTTDTRHKIPNLTFGTTYTVRVIATKTGVRDGLPSADQSLFISLGSPTVMASAKMDTLTVTWNAVPIATGYKVQWKSGVATYPTADLTSAATHGQATIVGGSTTTYKISNVTAGTTYTVRVIATSTNVNIADSDPSEEVMVTAATNKPTNVRLTPGHLQLLVAWSEATGATGYKVQWKSGGQSYDPSSRQATVFGMSTTTHAIENLTFGTTYTVRVFATLAGGSDSDPSDELMGVPLGIDYDGDGDGLIDITTLAQLNAIRYDLDGNGDATHAVYAAAFPSRDTTSSIRMGCPSGTCTGYELLNNLDFDENGDGEITSADATYWNGNAGWPPIGGTYTGTFKGNNKTISNLYINRLTAELGGVEVGLFGSVSGNISGLGLKNVNVNGAYEVGGLVGEQVGGRILGCFVTGRVEAHFSDSGRHGAGGLVGISSLGRDTAPSVIAASYANAEVIFRNARAAGGLVGATGQITQIIASYAIGPATGWRAVGGLGGNTGTGTTISASYATGTVTGTNSELNIQQAYLGGLVGSRGVSSDPLERRRAGTTSSYWDTESSGISVSPAGTGQTTSALQSETSYDGIYASWDVDVDGRPGNDAPWTFGAADQYPVLKYAGMDTTVQFAMQPPGIPTSVTVTPQGSTLDVRWTAASYAMGYKVQWKSGMQSYDASREAITTDTRTRIPNLAVGTTYTVRVIATKTGARDGRPSAEQTGVIFVLGSPTVMVAAKLDTLTVTWNMVTSATGYKVQWKSGSETYPNADEESALRGQATLVGGSTTTYKIPNVTTGTTYTVRVIATRTNVADSAPSEEVTVLVSPTGVMVRATVDTLTVTWNAVDDATGYKVQWKSGSETYPNADSQAATHGQATISDGGTTTYDISGLTAGTTYTVRIIATSTNSNVADSVPSEEVTGVPLLGSPPGVDVSATVDTLTVTWNAVDDATGYKVQWKSGSETYPNADSQAATHGQATITGGSATTYDISGLTAGTTYTIRVIATHTNVADSAPSEEVTGVPVLDSPTVMVAATVDTLTVTWNVVDDATGYKVQWKSGLETYPNADLASALRGQATLVGGSTTTYKIPNVTTGTTYTVRVIATRTNVADSAPSEEVTGVPVLGSPTVEVSATVDTLTVTWNVVDDATGYKVQWKSGSETYPNADEESALRGQATLVGGSTTTYKIPNVTTGTTYTVRVIATRTNVADSAPSEEVTVLVSPTGVMVRATVDTLTVTWNAVNGATGYKVQWKSGSETYPAADLESATRGQATIAGGSATTYKISGLTTGTTYTIRIIATSTNSNVADSVPSAEQTGVPVLGSPTGVDVVRVKVDTLTVTWNAVDDATGYKVQWKSGAATYPNADLTLATHGQATIAGRRTTTYKISGLTAGTTYTIRIIATRTNVADSAPSAEQTGVPVLGSPTVMVSATVDTLTVTWNAVPLATGYKVQWKSGSETYPPSDEESATHGQATIAGGSATTYKISGLTAGTTYTVRVIATRTNVADSAPSAEQTGVPVLGSPTVMVAAKVDTLTVTWNAVNGATGYKVQWKSGAETYPTSDEESATRGQATIAGRSATTYKISGLTAGTPYTIRVIATRTNVADSAPSAEVMVTSATTRPTNVRVTSGQLQLIVAWTEATGARGYKVQWKSGGQSYNTTTRQVGVSMNTRTSTIVNLTFGTTYTVRVLATLAGGLNSDPSDEVMGTPQAINYDSDGDGLINIETLAQLHAIRWDLNGDGVVADSDAANYNAAFPYRDTTSNVRMGCPSGTCTGYELLNNLNFDTDGSGSITSADTYPNWTPIGNYSATFKGNNKTISNLHINRGSWDDVGLFSQVGGNISGLGLKSVNVRGRNRVGGLVGNQVGGRILGCFVTGRVEGTGYHVGGLVGHSIGNNTVIAVSYANAEVSGGRLQEGVGGLVGRLYATVIASYAIGPVTGNNRVGGLVGRLDIPPSSVSTSYATGAVTGNNQSSTFLGGLIGRARTGVSHSYWDRESSGISSSDRGTSQTTSALQSETDYNGIYATWNVDVDGRPGNDDPWTFGAADQYPVLKYAGMDTTAQFAMQPPGIPTSVTVTPQGDTLDVRWTAASYATGYKVQWKSGGQNYAASRQAITTDTRYKIANLIGGTTYTVRVIATKTGVRDGRPSAEQTGVLLGIPAVMVAATVDTLTVTWNAVDDATGYKVQWKSGSETYPNADVALATHGQATIAGGRTTTYKISGLTAGTTYAIQVIATRTNVADSAPSDAVMVTLATNKPTNVSVTPGPVQLIVRWTEATSATGYKVQWKSGGQSYNTSDRQATVSGMSTTTYTIENLTFGTTYTVRVTATLAGGTDSTPSDEVMGTPYAINYDSDGDGLIDIKTLAQLHAIRWDLNGDGVVADTDTTNYNAAFPNRDTTSNVRMGCPSGTCTGYELLNNLNFDENGDGAITQADTTYWNGGTGWVPIGTYTGTFKGNNKTISNLYISYRYPSRSYNVGLFSNVSGDISGVGLLNVNVHAEDVVGGLVGTLNGGRITGCYVTGFVEGGRLGVGGLAGRAVSSGHIAACYSHATVRKWPPYVYNILYKVGGLVGHLGSGASVTASYATGPVSGHGGGSHVKSANGGLVGQNDGTITASYATGTATADSNDLTGGLYATGSGTSPASYWDTESSSLSTSAGGTGQTTSALQSETDYDGIYANWNVDVDGRPGNDDPWTFGAADQYPVLKYAGMDTTVQFQRQEEVAQVTLVLSPASIAETGAVSTVTATLDRRASAATTITVSAEAVSPAVASAFTLSNAKTLTIAANATTSTGTVTITAVNDMTDAPDKHVTVSATVQGGNGASLSSAATLTITDDDAAPDVALTLSPASISEAGGVSTVTATLSHASSAATTITVRPVADAYTVGSDSTIIIAAGSTANATDTVVITAVNNTQDAPNRDVTVSGVAGNAQGVGSVTEATLTLEDDDAAPDVTLMLSPASISEAGGVSTVTATLSHASSAATTITVRPVAGAYTVGSDTTITIAAGSTTNASDTVVITAVDNTRDEPARDVPVSGVARNAQGAGRVIATLTLMDDDAAPIATLAASPLSISENLGVSTITATLSRPSSSATTITVRPVAGAYTVAADSTITIAAGSTANASDTVVITAVNNTQDAPNRDVDMSVVAGNAQGARVTTTLTLTLEDDDPAPTATLAASPASISENGAVSTITASLSRPSSAATTITVRPVAGAYTVGSDTTITIAAGDTTNASDTVVITAVDNPQDAPNRSATVSGVARNAQGAGSVTGVTLTLTDDDDAPDVTMVVSPASISENGAISTVTATLSHTSSAATTVTVSVPTSSDYTLSTATTLTVAAGETTSTGTVTITTVDNSISSGNKTVTVTSTVGNSVGTGSVTDATLTIIDDEVAQVMLILSPASIAETGAVSTVTATLNRPENAATTITVSAMAVSPADANDFMLSSTNTLTIAASATTSTGTVTITAVNDMTDAPDKEVTVSATVQGGNMASLSSAVTLTITDDEAAPTVTLSLSPASISEASGVSTITATLSHRSSAAMTITVRPVAGAYTVGSDSTITIAAGSTANATDTVVITAVNNTQDEPDRSETVSVVARNAHSTGSVTEATLTLEDDDAAPDVTLMLSPASISEAGGMSTVSATLTHPSSAATTITVRPVANAYTVGSDSTITIAAGSTTNATDTVEITAVDNTQDAPNRNVTVSGVANNDQGAGSVTGAALTITDDDAAPDVTMMVAPALISEAGAVSTVTATLSHPSSAATTITVSASAVSPAVPGDFTLSGTATLTVAAGATTSTGTVTITTVDNSMSSGNKTVTVSASTVGNSIGTGSVTDATLTIIDDDVAQVTLVLSPASISEAGAVSTVTATLNRTVTAATTITVSAMAVSPAVAGDFTLSSTNTLTVAASVTTSTGTVTITSVNNTTDAPDKRVTVAATVAGGNGASLSSAVTLTITDDDAAPTVTLVLMPSSISENAEVSTITATLSHPSSAVTTITVSATPVSPATASDFTLSSADTLIIAATATTSTDTVTITAVDNPDQADDKTVTVSATANNAQGITAPSPVTLTLTDDDAPSANLDVDGDGRVRLFSDIILVIRYVLFFREEALLRGNVIEPTATRMTAQEIEPYLDTLVNQNILDVDGDGDVRLFSDIILIIRYVLFFRNEALVRGNVIEQNATRTTAQAIEPYIRSLYPDSHFQ